MKGESRISLWFLFGVFLTLSIVMFFLGILFIRDAYLHEGEMSAGSLILGILLFLVGSGLFSSAIKQTIKKIYNK